VITGPDLFNFQTVRDPLIATGGLTLAASGADLTARLAGHFSATAPLAIDAPALAAFFAAADRPMALTLETAGRLLDRGARP